MKPITIPAEQKQAMIGRLKSYLLEELDLDLGGFEAEFLLDFIGNEMGSLYYNQGLRDAQVAVSQQLDHITEALYVLERP